MTTTPDFADWLAICNLKADCCRLLDTKQWEAWGELFTQDCRLDSTPSGGSLVEGRDEMVAFVRDALSTAKTAHQVHTPQMRFDGPDAVEVTWAMQDRVVADTFSVTGYGHYHERCVRTEAGWRIAFSQLTRLIVEVDRAPG